MAPDSCRPSSFRSLNEGAVFDIVLPHWRESSFAWFAG